jgi:hypothetical protein
MGDSFRPPKRWSRNFGDADDDDAISPELFQEFAIARRVGVRRLEPDLPADPAVWLASNKMTQTEVCLRLAQYLLARRLTTTDVNVALTGYELTRRDRPRFPVTRFLTERGTQPKRLTDGWRGNYLLKGGAHALRLTNEPGIADVVTTLTSGARLLAHVSRGLLESSRSPAEHKLLRGAIGRAITCESAGPFDLLAAVVPRSKRFRELATEWRASEGARRARLLILTVDRAGNVDGLPHGDD